MPGDIAFESTKPLMIVVMGPASCGKSTIGQQLAETLKLPFHDGDDLHPPENVAKMTAGTPLTDADRGPWLRLIRETGKREARAAYDSGLGHDPVKEKAAGQLGRPAVVMTCSALKRMYRDILRGDGEPVDEVSPRLRTIFVYCHGSEETLKARIAGRKGHFMKPNMLASQLATLEDPTEEQGVVKVDIADKPSVVADSALEGVRTIVQQMDVQGV